MIDKDIHKGSSHENVLNRFCYFFILGSSLLFFFLCMNTQENNWDMLGYAASALNISEQNSGDIHEHVYTELRNYVSSDEFDRLTKNNSYRETMYADADAFMQQVPYYKIRVIFVGLIYVLAGFGVNIFAAGHMVSAAAASLGLLVFFYAYREIINPVYFKLLLPVLFVLVGVLDVGQKITADSLAFLWVALICWAFIKKHWFILPLLVTAVLIRTDLILLVALMLVYLFLFRPAQRFQVMVAAIATACLYVGVNKLAGNYGWSTVFYYVFVSDMSATHPQEFMKLGLSLEQYFSAIFNNIFNVINENRFLLFVLNVSLQLILFFCLNNIRKSVWEIYAMLLRNPVIALTLMSCGYLVLHFLLFPVLWSRFFVGQYMIAALGLFYMMTYTLDLKK